MDPKPNTVSRLWNAAALQVFHFCILFVLANVAIGFAYRAYDKRHAQLNTGAGLRLVHPLQGGALAIDQSLYAGQDLPTIQGMIHDMLAFDALGFPYQAYVGYTMPVYHSHTVNIDELDGFRYRRTAQAEGPPDKAIDVYMFGGSTMFGLNLRDQDTLAACLEAILNRRAMTELPGRRVRVFNWGVPGYYSTQEVALLDGLVRAGKKPALVLFLDGVNDCMVLLTRADVPNFTDTMKSLSDRAQFPENPLTAFSFVPMVRLAMDVRTRMHPPPPPPPPYLGPANRVQFVLEHNRAVAQAICKLSGSAVRFYLQPVSFYRYSLDDVNTIPDFVYDNKNRYAETYALLEKSPDVVSLAALPGAFGVARKPFLDFCHYTPQFNEYLAEAMAKHIDLKSLDTP